VAWYIRQRYADLDLPIWFMPDVDLQRRGGECEADSPFCGGSSDVIRRGDILHTDVGICYLRLCTDTQEMGYVLRPGEKSVPRGLVEAMAVGNRWQDLLTAEFSTGLTGIGMWDNQGPTPVKGDWRLYPDTAYAIEGNVKVELPEWDGQLVQIKLEQSAAYDGTGVDYLAGRQTDWHVVR
jgi:hypothetical protein